MRPIGRRVIIIIWLTALMHITYNIIITYYNNIVDPFSKTDNDGGGISYNIII